VKKARRICSVGMPSPKARSKATPFRRKSSRFGVRQWLSSLPSPTMSARRVSRQMAMMFMGDDTSVCSLQCAVCSCES